MTMQLISTVTVGSGGAASIDFTSIPQTGTDLLVVCSIRITNSTGFDYLSSKFNGLTSGYSSIILRGTGSAASSTTGAADKGTIGYINTGNETANTFSSTSLYISNYTSSVAKSYSADSSAENNATENRMGIFAGRQTTTNAITSLEVYYPFSNLAEYSSASLYVITKGSGGATVS